jgi:DNA polymerase IV
MAAGERIVLHVDMDAFYAAIEQRDEPRLRGKPVIVGGPSRRGVVSTASYEARPFGVHSAMPMSRALALCPNAIVVTPRMGRYLEVSEQVMATLDDFSPLVEPLSLDEAFLDMTGSERLFGPPEAMADAIRKAIVARTGLTASVGAAANKFLAKLASDLNKPDGVTIVPRGREAEFIAPLPVRRLWGVGPKSAERIAKLGLRTIGDVARAELGWLRRRLGASYAEHLWALANARDDRPVDASGERKSLGSETTLEWDVRGRNAVEPILRRQCERVARGLRETRLVAGGVRVKLRYSRGFVLATRQAKLDAPADDSRSLFTRAAELLERLDLDAPIRLVGAAAFDLAAAGAGQAPLFAERATKDGNRERAMDEIRARFGDKIDYAD